MRSGAYFRQPLAEALGDHRHVGEVRGEGHAGGGRVRRATSDDRVFFDAAQKDRPAASRPRCWSEASSAAPCRRATSSASRRRFA